VVSSVSILCERETPTLLGTLEKANLSQWVGDGGEIKEKKGKSGLATTFSVHLVLVN
jgi:hypothetical protein